MSAQTVTPLKSDRRFEKSQSCSLTIYQSRVGQISNWRRKTNSYSAFALPPPDTILRSFSEILRVGVAQCIFSKAHVSERGEKVPPH